MKLLLSFITLILCLTSVAQSFSVTEKLQERLNQIDDNDFVRVRVEFNDNVDCFYLNQEFKTNQTPVSHRPKIVISQLQNQSKSSQENLIQNISNHSSFKNIKSFWIVNILVFEIKKSSFATLEQYQNIALIDLEENKYVPSEEFEKGTKNLEKSINGVEPGLVAINAPALWALGYTGRSRLVYDYDTGVWPTHPAFSNRFMANHYPMEQCWYGYFSDIPNGIVNDHGTHTLGTIAGLDTQNNDTIGVAFKAYWIANDFVTPTVAGLPPITDMIGAFEWALNPDGDISTSTDIPDVINNSWRWYDGNDTLHCGGYIVNLMNAIEAAGIANVFSGGNSGPTNTTVNSPQRINTSEVNTFSVGAVNGNTSFPYPITDFSTRGPIQCEGTGSLIIHPEVVAPGYSVRSAWGTNEYNSISGTSMSAPHVSGALLLLKEAFPYLSGEDLLWSLYLTAIDMGDPGEDNVYGNGMIDVYQAYLYLSMTNSPVDPYSIPNDLEISLISPKRDNYICGSDLDIQIQLKNLGSIALTNVIIDYEINGQPFNLNWTGNLTENQSEVVNLPNFQMSTFGEQTIQLNSTISGSPNEYDLHNNKLYFKVNRLSNHSLVFTETFESGIDQNVWNISNIDSKQTWDTLTTVSRYGTKSASMQLRDYSPRNNQKDQLTSGQIDLTTATTAWLKYDFSYQKYHSSPVFQDTFKILVSTDCGANFIEVLTNHANDMATLPLSSSAPFIPNSMEHWRRDSVDLSSFGGNSILIRFETTNRQGNNLYIDNISVYENEDPLQIKENLFERLEVYPNPALDLIYIKGHELQGKTIVITDISGENLIVKNMSNNNFELDISQLSSGTYFINVSGYKKYKLIVR